MYCILLRISESDISLGRRISKGQVRLRRRLIYFLVHYFNDLQMICLFSSSATSRLSASKISKMLENEKIPHSPFFWCTFQYISTDWQCSVSAYLAAQDKREGKLNIFSSALPGCVGGKHLTLCLQVCVCMHVCACTRVCVSAYLWHISLIWQCSLLL